MNSHLSKRNSLLSTALILLGASTLIAGTNFQKEIISTNELGVERGFPIDVDGDSDTDMLLYSSLNKSIILMENDGSNNFTESTLLPDFEGIKFHAADLNGDSKMDIITRKNEELLYYLSTATGYERKSLGDVINYKSNFWTANLYGNGKQDLIVSQGYTLTLYKNSGEGVLIPQDTLSRKSSSLICQLNDFNNDGRLDIVSLATDDDAELTVYLQNSDQTFTDFDLDTIDKADNPILQVADVDGDSHKDIISLGDYNHVKWYKSGGDGTFTPMPHLSTYGEKNKFFLAGDIDSDGDDDYLIVDSLSKVFLYKNDGSGNFTKTIQECDEAVFYSPALIDYDQNGDLDLFTLHGGPMILTGMESGTLKRNTIVNNGTFGAWDVAVADIWGDSKKEILSVGRYDEKLKCYTKEDDGSYREEHIASHVKDAQKVTVADMNGDNLPDILTGGDTLFLFTQMENSLFEKTNTKRGEVHSISVADLDSDNDPDIITHAGSWVNPTYLTLHYNNGSDYTTESYSDIEAYVAEPVDIDGDGDIDIITGDDVKSVITLNRNEGDGTFFPIHITNKEYSIKDLHITDINSDDKPDILFTAHSYVFTLIQGEESQFTVDTLSLLTNCVSITPGDFNGDGHMDYAALSSSRSKVVLYENSGDMTFTETVIDSSKDIETGRSIISADIDDDGHLDILTASSKYGTIALYRNLNSTAITDQTIKSDVKSLQIRSLNSQAISLSLPSQKRTPLTFSLYDIRGREIKKIETVNSGNFTLNFKSPIAAGLYLMSLSGEGVSYSNQIVIK